MDVVTKKKKVGKALKRSREGLLSLVRQSLRMLLLRYSSGCRGCGWLMSWLWLGHVNY